MTTNEMIEKLRYKANNIKAHIEPEFFNDVADELERQIAKKPRINRVSDDTEYMKCPQCRLTTVLYSDIRPDYCPKCGQKLDLNEVE